MLPSTIPATSVPLPSESVWFHMVAAALFGHQ
jgi:hypothetical protein